MESGRRLRDQNSLGDPLFLRDGGLESMCFVCGLSSRRGPETCEMLYLGNKEDEEKECLEGKIEGEEERRLERILRGEWDRRSILPARRQRCRLV